MKTNEKIVPDFETFKKKYLDEVEMCNNGTAKPLDRWVDSYIVNPDGKEEKRFYFLAVLREEVESGSTERVLRLLNSLMEPERIHVAKDMLFFNISGYDNDPRELWEIPEVSEYMKKLDKAFPYWLHFIPMDFISFFIGALHNCHNLMPGKMLINHKDLLAFQSDHFNAINVLFNKGMITRDENIDAIMKMNEWCQINNIH